MAYGPCLPAANGLLAVQADAEAVGAAQVNYVARAAASGLRSLGKEARLRRSDTLSGEVFPVPCSVSATDLVSRFRPELGTVLPPRS